MRRQIARVLLALVTVVSFHLATAVFQTAGAAPKGARWGPGYFPNYIVTTHEGKKVRFYDDLIKDKIVIINFIYTNCADTCPLQTARLAEIQRRLGDDVGKRYFMYSVSLDPKRDTPEKMAEHAKAFGVKPGWLFITGDPKELAEIRRKLGEMSRSLNEHRTDMVIGNDHKGAWRRTSAFDDFDRAVLAIHEMDHEWRKRNKKERHYVSNYNLNAKRISLSGVKQVGQALYQKACAACHNIGGGRKVGPDLYNVTDRRQHDWLIKFIMHPDEMRSRKDPIAVTLDAQFPGTRMPYLGISKADAGDLLKYISMRSDHIKSASKKNAEKKIGEGG